jgi:hypothetical protein
VWVRDRVRFADIIPGDKRFKKLQALPVPLRVGFVVLRFRPSDRHAAVGEVIELVSSVDDLLQAQRNYDVEYFLKVCNPSFSGSEIEQLNDGLLKAYRCSTSFPE